MGLMSLRSDGTLSIQGELDYHFQFQFMTQALAILLRRENPLSLS